MKGQDKMWYEYDYACGHGCGSVQLFGPGRGRESTLRHYEKTRVCPKCYKAGLKARDEELGVIFSATLTALPEGPHDNRAAVRVEITGGTYEYRGKLKALGYSWGGNGWNKPLGAECIIGDPTDIKREKINAKIETEILKIKDFVPGKFSAKINLDKLSPPA